MGTRDAKTDIGIGKGQIAVDVASVWQSGKQVTKSEPECST